MSATSATSATSADTTATAHASRPRVAGDREQELLAAAIDVLREVGYDRLTFDAVAAAARASKATLYRKWPHKQELVIDALALFMGCPAEEDPDTGSLRGDLIAQACAVGGLDDEAVMQTWSALLLIPASTSGSSLPSSRPRERSSRTPGAGARSAPTPISTRSP